jgi:hypothetical protein
MVRVWSGAEKCRTDAERQLAQSQHARAHRERPPGHPRKSKTAPLPPNASHKLRLTSKLLLSVISELAAPPSPYANLKYDPVKDFTPTGLTAGLPIVIVTRKNFPANNLMDFVDYVKKNQDKVNEAHGGAGGQMHTTCILLQMIMGHQDGARWLSRCWSGGQ